MNPAIWKKAVSDAWRLLAICSSLLFLFSWLFVWMMSQFKTGGFGLILKLVPRFFQSMLGIPLADLATPEGRISIIYVHAITTMVGVGWAVGRGSDPITGEIGRGTLDLILSLPIRRVTALAAPATVAMLGTAVLAGCVWTGTWVGLQCVEFEGNVDASLFLPGAVNLFGMIFALTSITTLISSLNRDRWRTIVLSVGVFVISLIIEMVPRFLPAAWWLKYCSFLSAFQPQRLILLGGEPDVSAWQCNLTLLSIGLSCYLLAAIIFTRRDIPAPR